MSKYNIGDKLHYYVDGYGFIPMEIVAVTRFKYVFDNGLKLSKRKVDKYT